MVSTTPPERDPRSSSQFAETAVTAGTASSGFVRSLLAVAGVAGAVLAVLWTINTPSLDILTGLLVVLGSVIALIVSLALAISGLGAATSWRRAGGRGGLNSITIVLATLDILALAVIFVGSVIYIIFFLLALGSI